MNTEQEQRLEKVFKDNQNKGIAIAITGCWGVGKTFFWQNFLKSQTLKEYEHFDSLYYYASKVDYIHTFENKKYAYISLFGIESLDALKNEIAIKLGWNPHSQNVHKHYGIPQLLKKTLAQFKDIKFSHYGVSSSSKLVDSLLFGQVKNAIICFDDFERLSEKLKIQDVMGLANQLKLERNCQVVLILDESKTDGENKNKYAEYKEKLIDETIKITSVEPLIRENTKEIDEPLVNLMVKFADELEIHNFRFFQKVIKLYQQFRAELYDEVTYSTKEIILIRVLQGYFVEEFGKKYEFDWEDIKPSLENDQAELSEIKSKTYESLKSLDYRFIHSDEWLTEFKKWFDQEGEPDWDLLHDLANSTMISEENIRIKDDFHKLCEDFWGLRVDKDFSKKFYQVTKAVIGLENIHNLSFALKILELFNADVRSLEQDICEWIKEQKNKDRQSFYNIQKDDEIRPIFKELILNHRPAKEELPQLIDAIFQVYINKDWNDRDKLSIESASKEQWEKLLFEEINNDPRFTSFNSSYVVKKILDDRKDQETSQRICQLITEIYKEKAEKEPFYTEYMNYLISRLDN